MPGIPNHSRPMVRVETLVLAVTAWIVATANGPWWAAVSQGRDWFRAGNWLFLACCFVMLVGLHFAVIAPLAFRRVVRPLLTLLVVLSAGAAWYMSSYAVLLDPTMIQNVLHTDAHEARELLDPHMVGSVLLWSALPVAAIWLVRLEHPTKLRALGRRAACVGLSLLVAVSGANLGYEARPADGGHVVADGAACRVERRTEPLLGSLDLHEVVQADAEPLELRRQDAGQRIAERRRRHSCGARSRDARGGIDGQSRGGNGQVADAERCAYLRAAQPHRPHPGSPPADVALFVRRDRLSSSRNGVTA